MLLHELFFPSLPKVVHIDPSAISEGHVNLDVPGGRSEVPHPVSKLRLAIRCCCISAYDYTLSCGLTLEEQALISMINTFAEDDQDSYQRYFSPRRPAYKSYTTSAYLEDTERLRQTCDLLL